MPPTDGRRADRQDGRVGQPDARAGEQRLVGLDVVDDGNRGAEVLVDGDRAEHDGQRLDGARAGDPDVEDRFGPLRGERRRDPRRRLDRPDAAAQRVDAVEVREFALGGRDDEQSAAVARAVPRLPRKPSCLDPLDRQAELLPDTTATFEQLL